MSLIRVFEIPEINERVARPPYGYLFASGLPVQFVEVDWFRDDTPGTPSFETAEGREQIREFIRHKKYCKPGCMLLVLHPEWPLTIGYDAP